MSVLKQIAFKVKSDLKELEQILCHFDQLNQPWIPRRDWLQCQLALAEGFTNAVRHAQKNLPPETLIDIKITLNQHSLEIRIWDWGSPFDLEGYVKNLSKRNSPPAGHGEGLLILKKIAAHLSYLPTEDGRNCLLIVKEFANS